jgi:cobalamin synthase
MEHFDTNVGNDEVRKVWRHVSQSKLGLMRGISLGAAGFLAANTLVLVQVGVTHASLQVSLFSGAISLPLWVAIASVFESYIFQGRPSYSHLRSNFTINLVYTVMCLASLGLLITIVSIIWYLSFIAAICFIISGIFALCIMTYHDRNLKRYLNQVGNSKT